ncbi:MAG: hypothetical protein KDK12_17785 [Rhodobacteraceae bacterium]|nr:hypothetical protein [Paracoccaceae bacterium]
MPASLALRLVAAFGLQVLSAFGGHAAAPSPAPAAPRAALAVVLAERQGAALLLTPAPPLAA